MKIIYSIITILHLLITSNAANASAWLVPPGKTQFIGQNWNTHSNLHGNRYNTYNLPMYLNTSALNVYIEHGVFEKFSLGVTSNASWKRVDDNVSYNNTSQQSWDYIDIFGKLNVFKNDIFVTTLQSTASIPMYKEYTLHHTQSAYMPSKAYEARIMFGLGGGNGGLVSGILGGDGSFINLEFAYKKYESFTGYNEAKMQLDLGYKIDDSVIKMLLLQYFRTNKIYTKFTPDMIPYQNGYMHNDISQVLGSILLDIGSNTLMQFGLFYEVKGNYIGKSEEGNSARGLVLGIWM